MRLVRELGVRQRDAAPELEVAELEDFMRTMPLFRIVFVH